MLSASRRRMARSLLRSVGSLAASLSARFADSRNPGLAFRIFNHANTGAFPASAVLGLATDAEGSLWILLQSRELLRYRSGVFEPIARETGVTAIAAGMRRDLLLVRPEDTMRYVDRK